MPHRQDLEKLIEEATIDCYDEYEQRAGFCAMLEDNLHFPFKATVVGEEVDVVDLDQDDDRIVAICKRNGKKYSVDILSINVDRKKIKGSEWIDAYRKWSG